MHIQEIFLAAIEIDDPQRRAAYVAEACAQDSAMLRKVDALLAAHAQPGDFLAIPVLHQIADGAARNPDVKQPPQETDLSFLQPSTTPGSLGRLLHYEVREVVGRGGCGIVLKAFDEKLHRIVAIKTMTLELAATSPARKRFLREARAAAAIRHENVVSIYAVEEKPLPFLVMEYIDGPTLQDRIQENGPLEVSEVISIGCQVARGLEAAHTQGLVHRDIKPANILLEQGTGRPKITDFGLARSADDASLTQSGTISGTPLYMSPEQAQGAEVDRRSDLFSLGSVLYVMCSGRPPFRASTAIAVLKRVVEEQPRPIREIIPEVPEGLVAIVAKLHAKKPDERFLAAHEVVEALMRSGWGVEQNGHGSLFKDNSSQSMPPTPKAAPRPLTSAPITVQAPIPRENSRSRHRLAWATATLIVLLAASMSLSEASGVTSVASTIVRLFSAEGILVVEIDDPAVHVAIDGEELAISGAGINEIRLKPGKHQIQASKNGKLLRQQLVTVTRNGRQLVRISHEPNASDASTGLSISETPDHQRLVTGNAAPHGKPPTGRSVSIDRRTAEMVLSLEGRIRIDSQDKEILDAAELPEGPFRLTHIVLTGKRLPAEFASTLDDCAEIRFLDLTSTNITDEDLHSLRHWEKLIYLNLSDCRLMTDTGLASFQKCLQLEELHLCDTTIGDTGVSHFQNCRNLWYVDLIHSRVTDTGLKVFHDLPNLSYLRLPNAATDAGVEGFRDCRHLVCLRLDDTQVTDRGLECFQHCTGLRGMEFRNTKITDRGLSLLQGNLHVLDLALDRTPITDESLKVIANFTQLRTLDLRKTKISAAGINELHQKLPRCKITWDGGVIEPVKP